jgi:hypothetical protein
MVNDYILHIVGKISQVIFYGICAVLLLRLVIAAVIDLIGWYREDRKR